MKDLHSDQRLGRPGALAGIGELQRRKDMRIDRRTLRAWPLLPVPVGSSLGLRHAVPSPDWPQGQSIEENEAWKDERDGRDLGPEFMPATDAPLLQENGDQPQVATRSRALNLCLLASVALHLSCTVFLIVMPKPETVEVAGGGAVSVMLVGEQAFDSLTAGKADGEEHTPPVAEAKIVETNKQQAEATTTEESVQPVEEQTAEAASPPPAETVEANTAASEPVAATEPVETGAATALEHPAPAETAPAVENHAINPSAVAETGELAPETPVTAAEAKPTEPVEEPEKPRVEAIKPPEPAKLVGKPEKKPEKPKKEDKAEKKAAAHKKADTRHDAQQARAKSSKGDAGEAKSAAERGASSAANGARQSDPGNAATSNYPGKIAAKLRRALKYPRSAVSGSGGEARVAFTVLSNGTATSIRVVSSSGSPVLDQAALDAVRRASPFPPIPPEAGRQQWPFAVPVVFKR